MPKFISLFTFSKTPFFWLICVYITGILLADKLSGHYLFGLTALLSTGVLFCVIAYLLAGKWWFYPMIIQLLLIFAIVRCLQFHDGKGHSFAEKQQSLNSVTFEFMITESVGDKGFSRRIAKITGIETEQKALLDKKILLNFKSHTVEPDKSFIPGQIYSTTCHVSPIPGNGNPSSFDYKKYMHSQNIHFQAFPDTSKLVLLGMEQSFSPFRYFANIRRGLIQTIDRQLPDQRSSALVAALTLGEIGGLEASTLMSFSNTGARHVLTVSGMHVGIIMLILMFITTPLKKSIMLFRIIKNSILFAGLWIYIFLIGAQPAVLRAGFMLSVYLISVEMYKTQNSINTLSFSAFLLLFINPLMLFQLSFMFTYMALFSILVFYKPIYSLYSPKNKVIKYIWQLSSLSIAAQILMMPVSAYYFHIAPVYFLISGLIATPAALAIFSLTLVFFLEQFIFSGASNIFAYALDFVSRMFLDSNTFIESLPFSTFSNIWITWLGLMLIIVTVLIFSIALLSGRKSFIFYGLMMVLIMTSHHYLHQSRLDRHQEICIYSTRKDLAIDLFTNRICYSIKSDTLSKINEDFVYKNHRMKNGIEKVIQIGIEENYEDQNISLKDGILSMNNCRIFIYPMNKAFLKDVETQSKGHQYQKNISNVKQINLKGNYPAELTDILLVFGPEEFVDSIKEKDFSSLVVLPGHLPFWEAKAIKKLLLTKDIWDIREKGALSIVWE